MTCVCTRDLVIRISFGKIITLCFTCAPRAIGVDWKYDGRNGLNDSGRRRFDGIKARESRGSDDGRVRWP